MGAGQRPLVALEGDRQWTGSQLHLAWNPTLCEFPIAGVTNYHKPPGLKQNTFTLFLFLRSEIQNQSYENQGDHRAGSSKRHQRTVSFLASSNLYKQQGMWLPWLLTTLLPPCFLIIPPLLLSHLPLAPSCKGSWDSAGPTWVVQAYHSPCSST